MALEITARFDGLTWGELRKLVTLAADQPEDEEVLYAYDEGAYEATGILVFTTADRVAKEDSCRG